MPKELRNKEVRNLMTVFRARELGFFGEGVMPVPYTTLTPPTNLRVQTVLGYDWRTNKIKNELQNQRQQIKIGIKKTY